MYMPRHPKSKKLYQQSNRTARQSKEAVDYEALRLVEPEYEKKIKELTSTQGLSTKRPDRQKVEPELLNQIMDTINKRKVQIEEYKRENPTPQVSAEGIIGDIELVQTEYRKRMEEYNMFGKNYVDNQKEKYRRAKMVDQLVEDLDKYQEVLKKAEVIEEEEPTPLPTLPPKRKPKPEKTVFVVEPPPRKLTHRVPPPVVPIKAVTPAHEKTVEPTATVTLKLEDERKTLPGGYTVPLAAPRVTSRVSAFPQHPPKKDGASTVPLNDTILMHVKINQNITPNLILTNAMSSASMELTSEKSRNSFNSTSNADDNDTKAIETVIIDSVKSATESKIKSNNFLKASHNELIEISNAKNTTRGFVERSGPEGNYIMYRLAANEELYENVGWCEDSNWSSKSEETSSNYSISSYKLDSQCNSHGSISEFSTPEIVSSSFKDSSEINQNFLNSPIMSCRNNESEDPKNKPFEHNILINPPTCNSIVIRNERKAGRSSLVCPPINLPGIEADSSEDEYFQSEGDRKTCLTTNKITPKLRAVSYISSNKKHLFKEKFPAKSLEINTFLTVGKI